MIHLYNLDVLLQTALITHRYPAAERGGIYRPSSRPVERIGLALEPPPQVGNWVRDNNLDALWLHRPWRLDQAALPPDVGVLYHHLPFDETLTTGYNVPLAAALGLSELDILGYKTAPGPADAHLPPRPIGMVGAVPHRSFDEWKQLINNLFGGYDRAEFGSVRMPEMVAVVGAMNPALIQEAHECGVGLYLTGEYRKSAQEAVDETGMAVIAIGHRRTEEWGLRALAGLLREKIGVEVHVYRSNAPL
ncbi:Nif3-like dinuclear metal center hexameric protein [Fibrella aquatilis]|uniref:Nif3-like dinuclear metal center hexameric protein n=1 Tax=Fibrella aquatilis TaxID=2817059 RepID=A0A939G7Y0_9BACT|nr:Nif3-like dinuclear metal center hexameric protein [Fibrella aquatilis]MBO0931701.1 Nif3-like dinuclear metal center hexameric protein [Fibrella aquatilis]